jgi:hypothetical protein
LSEVSAFLFRHDYLCLWLTCVLLQLSSLPPSELSHLIRYPRSKELTDDEKETSSSPKRQKSSPVAEEARPSREEPVAEEPMATIHHGVWYVSNVSIIFDAPCLFLHHLPCVLLHFMAFLCDFRN